jgi:hypothetical protein
MSGPHEGRSFLHCSYPIYSPVSSTTWQLGMTWPMFCACREARCILSRAGIVRDVHKTGSAMVISVPKHPIAGLTLEVSHEMCTHTQTCCYLAFMPPVRRMVIKTTAVDILPMTATYTAHCGPRPKEVPGTTFFCFVVLPFCSVMVCGMHYSSWGGSGPSCHGDCEADV